MKKTKGFFAGYSVGIQTGVLFAGLLTGFIVNVIFTVAAGWGNQTVDLLNRPVPVLQAMQFVASVTTFLLPAFVTAWFCSKRPADFLYLHGWPEGRKVFLIALIILLISPAISLAGHFNMQMRLPAFMASAEAWMREMEDLGAALTERMISGKSAVSFLTNLAVIAVTAGVAEEFLFRGVLFSLFRPLIRNRHVLIWTIAFIFSAIHLQFYGFIPRLLLGACLGYLLCLTNTIWAPVFAHVLNNALVIAGMSVDSWKENTFFSNEIAAEDMGWFSVMAGVCSVLFFLCMRRIAGRGKR